MKIVWYILGLFGYEPTFRLYSKSTKAVKTLTDTVDNLKSLSEKIETKKGKQKEKIAKLQDTHTKLDEHQQRNDRIAGNIDKLING